MQFFDSRKTNHASRHPYGTTAYQAANEDIRACAKRYRYTGKERDEESGLYYHGARYYIPWLCRWSSVDPLESKYAGMSPYNYSFNNPVMWNDLSGADPDDGDPRIKTKSKPKVDPHAVKELTKNLDKGGERATKETARALEKELGKQVTKKVEKSAWSKFVSGAAQFAEVTTKIAKGVAHINIVYDVVTSVIPGDEAHAPTLSQQNAFLEKLKSNVKKQELEVKNTLEKFTTDFIISQNRISMT